MNQCVFSTSLFGCQIKFVSLSFVWRVKPILFLVSNFLEIIFLNVHPLFGSFCISLFHVFICQPYFTVPSCSFLRVLHFRHVSPVYVYFSHLHGILYTTSEFLSPSGVFTFVVKGFIHVCKFYAESSA